MGAAQGRHEGTSEPSKEELRGSHLFIEMEELHGDRWAESGRWNHALEESWSPERQEWSRPHLPTISVPALVQLRSVLSPENLMLDMGGSSLAEVVQSVLGALVSQGALSEETRPLAAKALAGARKPVMPQCEGAPASSAAATAARSLSRGRLRAAGSSGLAAGSSGLAADQDRADNLRMLEPDKGEEALDLILAHVPFVTSRAVAFVRLRSPIDAGLEGHAVSAAADSSGVLCISSTSAATSALCPRPQPLVPRLHPVVALSSSLIIQAAFAHAAPTLQPLPRTPTPLATRFPPHPLTLLPPPPTPLPAPAANPATLIMPRIMRSPSATSSSSSGLSTSPRTPPSSRTRWRGLCSMSTL